MPFEARHVSFPSGSLKLEAVLSLPEETEDQARLKGVVICHPHPLYGGDMHNNVVAGLANGLAELGLVTLRFNFRGVGTSEGVFGHGEREQEDARAAVQFLANQPNVDPDRLAIAGYSFGASIALSAAAVEPLVAALVAISLPGARVNPEIFRDRALVKLFIAGAEDHIARPQALREELRRMPPPTVVHIAPQVDHFWYRHEGWLVEKVHDFLQSYLGMGVVD